MKKWTKNDQFFIFQSNNLNDFLAISLNCHHETYILCQSNLCQLKGIYLPSLKTYRNHSYHFPALKWVKEYQTWHSLPESVKNLTYSCQYDHWSKTLSHICLASGLEFFHGIQTEMNTFDIMYNPLIFLCNVANFPERKLALIFSTTIVLVYFSKLIIFYQ